MLCAHTNLEAQYAYLGMALQGNFIDGLFGPMRAVFALFLIIGLLWATASMALRGEASRVLVYLVFFVATFALLSPKMLMTADTRALMTGESGSKLAKVDGGARVNTLFFAVVRGMCAVRDGLLSIMDTTFGRNVGFKTGAFAMQRGMSWAFTQEVDDAALKSRIHAFFEQCLGPTEAKLQEENKAGSIFGYFGNLGDLIGLAASQEDQNTVDGMANVPLTGTGTATTCQQESLQIKSLWQPWTNLRKEILTEKLGQVLNEAQINEITGTALYAAAVKSYRDAQAGVGQGLMPAPAPGQEETQASLWSNPAGWLGQKFGNIVSAFGEVFLDFIRGLMTTVVPAIQGWAVMILYAVFPIVALTSLLPGMHLKIVDYFGAVWWVHSWTFFLGVISHILEALYGLRGGSFGSLTELGSANTELARNAAWIYLFLVTLTPFVSYTLFFGRLGNLAGLRFRFVGLGRVLGTGVVATRAMSA